MRPIALFSLFVFVGGFSGLALADNGAPIETRVRKRKARAIARDTKACDAGDAAACDRLGLILVESFHSYDGPEEDGARARKRFQRACDLGSVAGCRDLGNSYQDSSAVPQDPALAEQFLKKACDANDPEACDLLGWHYEFKRHDLGAALPLYQRVCEGPHDGLGCNSGCNRLASYSYYGEPGLVKKDRLEAARLYQRACDAGCINSCDTLGEMCRNGDGVAKDAARAATLYAKGCDAGFSPSCRALGELYRDGNGVRKDVARGRRLQARACRLSRNQEEGCGS